MSEAKLPTKEEIAELPRWARVAFAARCARRVLPLFKAAWPDAPDRHVAAVAQMVEFIEQSATATTATTATTAARAAYARDAARDAAANATAAANAAYAATAAASAAANAAYAANVASPYVDAVDAAGDAADAATYAAAADAAFTARSVTIDAIAKDFQLLRNRARTEGWNVNTHVPPDVFGPLWPDGPPQDWPVETSEGEEIVLEIEVPFGTTTEVAAAFVKNLLSQADDLDRALGGHGLMVESVNVYGDDSAAGRGRVAS